MPINQNWYDRNAGRQYPVDDAATGTDDAGNALTSTILADAHIRFPDVLGDYCFIGAAAVSPRLMTVVFLAAHELDDTGGFTPIAAVSVVDPVPYKMYAVQSQYPGAGGYVVFGEAIKDSLVSHRFSSPQQSYLTARSVKPYKAWPVSSLAAGELGSKLTGVVRLRGGNDIEIVKECREIPVDLVGESCNPLSAIAREAIVIRLKDNQLQNTEARNVFDIYKGCCAGRPETRTCDGVQPIESINGVSPNCCGGLLIRVKGIARPSISEDSHSIVLDSTLGLSNVCLNDTRLPDSEGRLPNDYIGDCEEQVSDISICIEESDESDESEV